LHAVEPEVSIVGRSHPDWQAIAAYLDRLGVTDEDQDKIFSDEAQNPEDLVEFGGRLCYRSWAPGLNPNVSKIRTDHRAYLLNILKQGHGSVLEHISWNFLFSNVSRVFTHELVRHRAGTAVSQESMRYVRLDDLPFWFPDWAAGDPELFARSSALLLEMERHQQWMAEHFGLDQEGTDFSEKKAKTSFMRRFAPDGVGTSVMWSCNARELRHVIAQRTAAGAEEEIRLVFGKVAELMQEEAPALFADFEPMGDGIWQPVYPKV
jgi:thymidylate synthase (FAD)